MIRSLIVFILVMTSISSSMMYDEVTLDDYQIIYIASEPFGPEIPLTLAMLRENMGHEEASEIFVAMQKITKEELYHFLLFSIMEGETNFKNDVNKAEIALGYWQMKWDTVKALKKLFPKLTTVNSPEEFLANISIQLEYANQYFLYMEGKFGQDISVLKRIKLWNGGEFNYPYSKPSYFMPIENRYNSLVKKSGIGLKLG